MIGPYCFAQPEQEWTMSIGGVNMPVEHCEFSFDRHEEREPLPPVGPFECSVQFQVEGDADPFRKLWRAIDPNWWVSELHDLICLGEILASLRVKGETGRCELGKGGVD